MTLKTKTVTIEEGRDQGKVYLITEMPLIKADRWATRALLAVMKGGVDIEKLDPNMGMLGMATVAIKALSGLDPETAVSLLDELLECVQIVPTGGNAREVVLDSDIKDLKTLFILRKEALAIHIDFLVQGGGLDLKG